MFPSKYSSDKLVNWKQGVLQTPLFKGLSLPNLGRSDAVCRWSINQFIQYTIDYCLLYFRQITGIGAGGSFQLGNSFLPSPAILSGDADLEKEQAEEQETKQVEEKREAKFLYRDDNRKFKEEVYVVRKTKSGRTPGATGSDAPKSKRR